MNTPDVICRVAFRKARRQDPSLKEDMIDDALAYYYPQALSHLHNVATYDPELYATSEAESAIIEYLVAEFLGEQPRSSQSVRIALMTWARAAAVENYDDNPNTYPDYPEITTRIRSNSWRKNPNV